MTSEVSSALERLFASGDEFDRVIRVLQRNRRAAVTALARLLKHPDPGWRIVAATALGRMRETPRKALPHLLDLLGSTDARARVAALSAIEWLPPDFRHLAVPSVIHLLTSRAVRTPRFTVARAHVPRAVAAHFLGTHGGVRGLAALRRAARHRTDPMIHHIEAALQQAASTFRLRARPPHKRLQPTAAGAIMSRRG